MRRQPPDILYLIRARLDSGTMYGASQLKKDRRVLRKAAEEIERLRLAEEGAQEAFGVVVESNDALRQDVERLQGLLDNAYALIRRLSNS